MYEVIGADMQIVNILLDPQVKVEVSPGAMMHHGPSIYAAPECSISCGRFWTGESNLQVTFENHGHDPEIIGLTPIYPAKVVPLHLADGDMTCRKNSYMCGVGDVSIGFDCDCNPNTNCMGGLGMVRQKLTGKGIAFIQAGGTVLEKTLKEGESIFIDQMSLVAWSSSIKVLVSQICLGHRLGARRVSISLTPPAPPRASRLARGAHGPSPALHSVPPSARARWTCRATRDRWAASRSAAAASRAT